MLTLITLFVSSSLRLVSRHDEVTRKKKEGIHVLHQISVLPTHRHLFKSSGAVLNSILRKNPLYHLLSPVTQLPVLGWLGLIAQMLRRENER